MNKKSTIAIIGSGFSGLSTATYLSAAGFDVHVFEKNATIGGRSRKFVTEEGYSFDMGPSWYWMPDVFEKYFADFGYKVSDFYDLKLLSPSFDIVFGKNDIMQIPANYLDLLNLFETIEIGSAAKLQVFMKEAQYKYEVAMNNLVHKPGLSIKEFADIEILMGAFRLELFSSFSKHIKKFFNNPRLIALMEFPILFLGATAKQTPALYSLMNYAGLKLGTWYPMGGFGKVIDGMVTVAVRNGVTFHFNATVGKIEVTNNLANKVIVNDKEFICDGVVSSADYHHTEQNLLKEEYRNYNKEYWDKKTFAPSSLIYYLGIKKKIDILQHHTLFFDEDMVQHSGEIYENPVWPSKPLFYACCPSKTDDSVAPKGHENIFLLMPIATGLEDNETIREKYFKMMLERLSNHCGEDIEAYIDYKKSYCSFNFIEDYNSFKGNAYGLANTLFQTAIFKPKIANKKVKNLFYTGQLTVPGPGIPPSIISGKLAAQQIIQHFKR